MSVLALAESGCLCERVCEYPDDPDDPRVRTMGCVVCSQLVDMWTVRARGPGRRAVELTTYPHSLQGGYHRVTGLHYMSSFSDAEDCCDDSSSGSSPTLDWQVQGADG